MFELSKTTYMRGLRCEKALYLNQHHPTLRNPFDPADESRLQFGLQVHEIGRSLIPGGENANPGEGFNPERAVEKTGQLLQAGVGVIYEAAFLAEGVLVYVDILERNGEHWNLYEVKGTTSVKEEHLPDLAVQAFVAGSAGLELGELAIVHLNPEYVRQGDLSVQELFRCVSVREQLLGEIEQVPERIERLREVLLQEQVPAVDIGPYCSVPYECDFTHHCWRHIPGNSVFQVAWLSKKKKFDLYRSGILRMQDIPADYPMGDSSRFQVNQQISGQQHIDQAGLREFIDSLEFPLCFLDFETFNPPIPPYDGLRPYQQIPFQFSLHIQESPGGEASHTGFLAEVGEDPRPAFLEEMLTATRDLGSLVTYNQAFEAGVLKGLIESFPQRRGELEDRLNRLKDLMAPFRARYFYSPAMGGSFSLKSVLPVMVEELDYSGLAIADGQAAMDAFVTMQSVTDPQRVASLRQDLWEYCKLDTLALVRILQELYEVVS